MIITSVPDNKIDRAVVHIVRETKDGALITKCGRRISRWKDGAQPHARKCRSTGCSSITTR